MLQSDILYSVFVRFDTRLEFLIVCLLLLDVEIALLFQLLVKIIKKWLLASILNLLFYLCLKLLELVVTLSQQLILDFCLLLSFEFTINSLLHLRLQLPDHFLPLLLSQANLHNLAITLLLLHFQLLDQSTILLQFLLLANQILLALSQLLLHFLWVDLKSADTFLLQSLGFLHLPADLIQADLPATLRNHLHLQNLL